jgi:plasmid stabilization system protein ParE
LQSRIVRLLRQPLIGIAGQHSDVRILPPTRYPYRIYYTIQDDEIVILHIRHTARQEPVDLA